jgi:hypothetical protein
MGATSTVEMSKDDIRWRSVGWWYFAWKGMYDGRMTRA